MINNAVSPVPFLITRPAGKADNLLASLDELNIGYLYQPLIKTALVALTVQDKQFLQQADIQIFVSLSAVSSLQNQCDAALIKGQLCAVGQTTAAALEQWLSRDVLFPQDQRSEGLLQLPELLEVAGKDIVIVRANAGRELMKQELTRRGACVRYIQSYKRELLALDGNLLFKQWQQADIRCIVATSNEILQQIFNLLSKEQHQWLSQRDWILVSPRMQESAIELGIPASRITLAENANDSALLDAINQLQRKYT